VFVFPVIFEGGGRYAWFTRNEYDNSERHDEDDLMLPRAKSQVEVHKLLEARVHNVGSGRTVSEQSNLLGTCARSPNTKLQNRPQRRPKDLRRWQHRMEHKDGFFMVAREPTAHEGLV